MLPGPGVVEFTASREFLARGYSVKMVAKFDREWSFAAADEKKTVYAASGTSISKTSIAARKCEPYDDDQGVKVL